MYGGEESGEAVRAVLAVADEIGPGLAPPERARVHRHFRITSRYEWMFWDMGYRGQPANLTGRGQHPKRLADRRAALAPKRARRPVLHPITARAQATRLNH